MCLYLNTDKKLIKKGGRKANMCSIDFLKTKIENVLKKSSEYDDSEIEDMLKSGDISIIDIFENSSKIETDLGKVQFDLENCTSKSGEFTDYGGLLVGFHTLSNGLSFLGCLAEGDWEYPVFFIIYYDGKSLRGYVPICGNLINRDGMSAFGNNDDEKFMQKELGADYNESSWKEVQYNWDLIEEDIKSRIVIS